MAWQFNQIENAPDEAIELDTAREQFKTMNSANTNIKS